MPICIVGIFKKIYIQHYYAHGTRVSLMSYELLLKPCIKKPSVINIRQTVPGIHFNELLLIGCNFSNILNRNINIINIVVIISQRTNRAVLLHVLEVITKRII